MYDPAGAVECPAAWSISTSTRPSGVTARSTFPTTSLNQSRFSEGRHSGPSVNWKPPATFSTVAPAGTRASSPGSSRTIAPLAAAGAGARPGPSADVQPPDYEMRLAILRIKDEELRLALPSDVAEYIAQKDHRNIRELEGALIRVTAFASLNRQPVDMGLAEVVLKDLIPEGGEADITAAGITAATAEYFGVTIDELCGSSRSRILVNARQVAMYLCRELTDLSLPRIGKAFGGRDHTTVMHADRKVRSHMAERRQLYNQIAELTNRIKQRSAR